MQTYDSFMGQIGLKFLIWALLCVSLGGCLVSTGPNDSQPSPASKKNELVAGTGESFLGITRIIAFRVEANTLSNTAHYAQLESPVFRCSDGVASYLQKLVLSAPPTLYGNGCEGSRQIFDPVKLITLSSLPDIVLYELNPFQLFDQLVPNYDVPVVRLIAYVNETGSDDTEPQTATELAVLYEYRGNFTLVYLLNERGVAYRTYPVAVKVDHTPMESLIISEPANLTFNLNHTYGFDTPYFGSASFVYEREEERGSELSRRFPMRTIYVHPSLR